MKMLGGLSLGDVPRIAVPLSDRDVAVHADAVRRCGDIVELRIDRFARHDVAATTAVCTAARDCGQGVIATIRSASEGGAVELPDAQRLALFDAVIPHVDAVDIELRAAICGPVVAMAHRHGKLAIVSHHDFARTASDAELAGFADGAAAADADVIKLATHVSCSDEVDRLLGLLREYRRRGAVVIAMGPHGIASRVFFPLLGSLITYGFVGGQAGAPGQLPLEALHAELCRYSPPFARAHAAAR
jgi:3-dehydroquinate dehydratase-1